MLKVLALLAPLYPMAKENGVVRRCAAPCGASGKGGHRDKGFSLYEHLMKNEMVWVALYPTAPGHVIHSMDKGARQGYAALYPPLPEAPHRFTEAPQGAAHLLTTWFSGAK